MDDTQLLVRRVERHVRIDQRHDARIRQDLVGSMRSVLLLEDVGVVDENRIGVPRRVDGPHEPVPILAAHDSEAVPELVRPAVAGEQRYLRRWFLPLGKGRLNLFGRFGRRDVNHHRVHEIIQVLDQHLPVVALDEPERTAHDLELSVGRARRRERRHRPRSHRRGRETSRCCRGPRRFRQPRE